MSFRWALITGSLLAHAGLVVALGGIRTPSASAATSIEMMEAKEPPAAEVAPTPPPPPQEEAVPRVHKAKTAAAPPPESPLPAQPQAQALSNLPDFGLELSGGGGGPGGVSVPAPQIAAPRVAAAPVTKTLTKAPARQEAIDTCAEGPAKPKLLNLPQPTYTAAARAAGLEGKVRVQLTVDETGKVVSVQALSTLGDGLDEAALTAAKGATFEPAMRCGRPSRSTFTISIRFSAS